MGSRATGGRGVGRGVVGAGRAGGAGAGAVLTDAACRVPCGCGTARGGGRLPWQRVHVGGAEAAAARVAARARAVPPTADVLLLGHALVAERGLGDGDVQFLRACGLRVISRQRTRASGASAARCARARKRAGRICLRPPAWACSIGWIRVAGAACGRFRPPMAADYFGAAQSRAAHLRLLPLDRRYGQLGLGLVHGLRHAPWIWTAAADPAASMRDVHEI